MCVFVCGCVFAVHLQGVSSVKMLGMFIGCANRHVRIGPRQVCLHSDLWCATLLASPIVFFDMEG